MRALLVVVTLVSFGCSEGSRPSRSSGKSATGTRIRLLDGGTIEVGGLSGPAVRHLESEKVDPETWERLLVVRVAGDESLPPVLGDVSFEDGIVRFAPTYPLRPGVEYTVVWNGERLPVSVGGTDVERTVSLPAPEVERTTVVERIDPPGDVLPENLLRLYVHFSAPMSRGRSYEHVRLLDANGDEVEASFLEIGEELWDGDGRRFTLFFDPGRVKRELVPNRELGRALAEGETYTLVVDKTWKDARGALLVEAFSRTFEIGPADSTRPDPTAWTLVPPKVESPAALEVSFDEPLDRPMTARMLQVETTDGDLVPGRFEPGDDGRSGRFTPERPWTAGEYALVVDARLEDVAGNSVGRPFEVEIDTDDGPSADDPAPVRIPFDVAP